VVTRRQITSSTTEAVNFAEVKDFIHLHSGTTANDAEVKACIHDATRYCEGETHRAFLTSTWKLVASSFYIDQIPLAVDLQSVTSVVYTDSNGVDQTADPSTYLVDTDSFVGSVRPTYNGCWPSTRSNTPNAVRITYTCGYGDSPSDLPSDARRAIKLMAAYYFLYRSPILTGTIVNDLPFAVDALLGHIAVPEVV